MGGEQPLVAVVDGDGGRTGLSFAVGGSPGEVIFREAGRRPGTARGWSALPKTVDQGQVSMDSHSEGPVGHAGFARRLRMAAIGASLLATGCTMCPDPFDYSGPVPNGSVAQNDFAARSNGNRPVRATPLPWPPIVDSSRQQPTPADQPDATVLVAAEAPAAPVERQRPETDVVSVADVPAAEGDERGLPQAPATEAPQPGLSVPSAATGNADAVAVVSPDDSPVTVPPGVVPPRGAWMTRNRRLPPPGNVPSPAERAARRKPAEPESSWREATRSLLQR